MPCMLRKKEMPVSNNGRPMLTFTDQKRWQSKQESHGLAPWFWLTKVQYHSHCRQKVRLLTSDSVDRGTRVICRLWGAWGHLSPWFIQSVGICGLAFCPPSTNRKAALQYWSLTQSMLRLTYVPHRPLIKLMQVITRYPTTWQVLVE